MGDGINSDLSDFSEEDKNDFHSEEFDRLLQYFEPNDFDLVANEENILFSGDIEEGEDTVVPFVNLDITTIIQLIFIKQMICLGHE